MLSQRQVEDICLVYKGPAQCRYLEGDPNDHTKFYCRKFTPDRKIIDEVLDDHLRDCAKNGTDPQDGNNALGDNCKGFVCFKDKIQGYDVEDK